MSNPIAKVNRGWGIIALGAITIAVSSKIYRSNRRFTEEITDDVYVHPGAYVGEPTSERKSPYEGGGNSYLGRKGGDRFS